MSWSWPISLSLKSVLLNLAVQMLMHNKSFIMLTVWAINGRKLVDIKYQENRNGISKEKRAEDWKLAIL